MKLHLLIFSLLFLSSCSFFSQKDPVKEKATALFEKITTQKNELKHRIEALAEHKAATNSDVPNIESEVISVGNTVNDVYKFWMTAYEKYKKQEVYMNYDLQVIRLEALEKTLNKINDMVEEGEKMTKE